MHAGITIERIEHVLENWMICGTHTDEEEEQSIVYLAFVPARGLRNMVRVAVSMDDKVVITAFADRKAATNWNHGRFGYFSERYRDLEMRPES